MRTETTTRNLYKFEELTETAKQKAIESNYDLNVDYEWWNYTYEDAKQVGITITSFDLDRNRNATSTIDNCHETAKLILNNHGETCETYKTAKRFLAEYMPLKVKFDKAEEISQRHNVLHDHGLSDLLCKLENEIDDATREFKQSITEDYSIILQKQYEYLYSDEAIQETIEANEHEFTEDGKLA